ncbi:MAG: hypothetical protein ACXVWT_18575 [Solirubrobacteraceae bacterium]
MLPLTVGRAVFDGASRPVGEPPLPLGGSVLPDDDVDDEPAVPLTYAETGQVTQVGPVFQV